MRVAGKVWGQTSEIFATSTFELHRIEVRHGRECSKHSHRTKFNGFFVESGALEVTVWQPTGTVDVTVLTAGDSMIVPPGVVHQFRGNLNTVAFEAYWTELLRDDIVRNTTGK